MTVLSDSETRKLNQQICNCDPGYNLSLEDTKSSIFNIDELVAYEADRQYGDLNWLYLKIKANADYHKMRFNLPGEYVKKYNAYKVDVYITQASIPVRVVLNILRKLGLVKSFLYGNI